MAHIGVIRSLQEAGLSVAGIAGTSIGAAVGGVHCAGVLDSYEKRMRSMTRREVVTLLDPALPSSGLFGGARLERLMRELCGDLRIEALDLPFVAVAADLADGAEVRLQAGDLVAAVRASSSIPGIFRPVRQEGRWLVDGGLVSPVPVLAARTLGPHPIVAVNLNQAGGPPLPDPADEAANARETESNSPPAGSTLAAKAQGAREELGRHVERLKHSLFQPSADRRPGLIGILNESIAIGCNHLAQSQLTIDPPDLFIEPNLAKVGLFDLHRTAELIDEGARAARFALDSEAGQALLARA
jgi:NTE family protein